MELDFSALAAGADALLDVAGAVLTVGFAYMLVAQTVWGVRRVLEFIRG